MHVASPIDKDEHVYSNGNDDEAATEGGDEMDVNNEDYDLVSDSDNASPSEGEDASPSEGEVDANDIESTGDVGDDFNDPDYDLKDRDKDLIETLRALGQL